MADYKDPYVDPEKSNYDDNGILPTTSVQQGTHRRVSITDAVFGEISEDGPNYRAVRARSLLNYSNNVLISAGRLERYSCAHAENTNWTWCSFYSSGLPQPRVDSRCDHHPSHRNHDQLVELHRRRV